MKKFSIFMLAALALVACNKEQNAVVGQPEADQTPVSFGAYVNRPITKAGFFNPNLGIGDLQSSTLASGAGGFGVFAYYTNADNYDQTFTPNFMYNQQVTYTDGSSGWQYSPVKYWPNEFGNNAASDDADKMSLFAYAPYVSVNVASGKVNGNGQSPLFACDNGHITEGIVGMKRNNATGDPMIQYIVSAYPDEQVDLLWGIVGSTVSTGTVDWNKKNTGKQELEIGMPYLNIEHPEKTSSSWTNAQKVNFQFNHALASLIVTVDTKTNTNATTGTNPAVGVSPDSHTKVFIRSVTFEGFDTKGALNLNNIEPAKALWYNFDCNNELNNGAEFTVYDGRKDGKEGLTAANKEYAAINPMFVQDTVFSGTSNGVHAAPANLFRKKAPISTVTTTDPILVIPNGDKLKVTIDYDVLTEDSSLATMLNDGVTPGSVVKNVISRYITVGASASGLVVEPPRPADLNAPANGDAVILQNGKQYTISLHLGLNSVEFDASVSTWLSGGNGGADLPHNNGTI